MRKYLLTFGFGVVFALLFLFTMNSVNPFKVGIIQDLIVAREITTLQDLAVLVEEFRQDEKLLYLLNVRGLAIFTLSAAASLFSFVMFILLVVDRLFFVDFFATPDPWKSARRSMYIVVLLIILFVSYILFLNLVLFVSFLLFFGMWEWLILRLNSQKGIPFITKRFKNTVIINSMDKKYITTTLPYVNDDPHIGHAVEFVQADISARYLRSKYGKENVILNVGTDEHGQKMFNKAKEAGKPVAEYVDYYADRWKGFCERFNISYDSFYRTTSTSHVKVAQSFWEKVAKKGDIYKKHYKGLYCVGCESFKTEKELVEGKCPDHGVPPIEYSEENYFFKLSKYKDELLNFYENNTEIIKPDHKRNEIINWIKNMEDISISRVKENLPWGVPVPGDEDQVMYVWFDALTNYVGAIGYPDDTDKLNSYWPGIQLFGPDNLRFQAGIWQAMLLAADLPLSDKLLCHGMILAEDGTKMSKSLGNSVRPLEELQESYQLVEGEDDHSILDAIRYYLAYGIPTYSDSAYKRDDLVANYNSHLASNYGNLVNRVLHIAKIFEVEVSSESVSEDFKSQVEDSIKRIELYFDNFKISGAIEKLSDLVSSGNKYIDENKPWNKEINQQERVQILNNLVYLITVANKYYSFIIPNGAAEVTNILESKQPGIAFKKIERKDA